MFRSPVDRREVDLQRTSQDLRSLTNILEIFELPVTVPLSEPLIRLKTKWMLEGEISLGLKLVSHWFAVRHLLRKRI